MESSKGSSLYGQDMVPLLAGHEPHRTALGVARHVLTHGGMYDIGEGMQSLGLPDLAAYEVLEQNPDLPRHEAPLAGAGASTSLVLYVNSLGRLHIRTADAPRIHYDSADHATDLGFFHLDVVQFQDLQRRLALHEQREQAAYERVLAAMQKAEATGLLPGILEGAIDHVQHVESVCFYVRDKFFAVIDRFANLVDTKASPGHLTGLRGTALKDWSDSDVIIIAALHALFLSGRSVRFEEFNGLALTAEGLIRKLDGLHAMYTGQGCAPMSGQNDLFEFARYIRVQSMQSVGQRWLRYRRIFGLHFRKNEQVAASMHSTESTTVHLDEFQDDYGHLVSSSRSHPVPECLFFTELASACLALDAAGEPWTGPPGSAARGWVEGLMEKIVASAVKATASDYGMSSSIRDIAHLLKGDDATLFRSIHDLTPVDFFTCFVSQGFAQGLAPAEAAVIASSVQKRMMFNRWHFIPGNLQRDHVEQQRHWYYPPLVPDIAVHSDVHRAAHARARVKYSIRSPGPDMSRRPLTILNHAYRGFYDVRVVRMSGPEFGMEELLRTRRRTLWLEAVYTVLTSYLQDDATHRFQVGGFKPGAYLDLALSGGLPNLACAEAAGAGARQAAPAIS